MIEVDTHSCKHNFLRLNITITQIIISLKKNYRFLLAKRRVRDGTRKLQDMPTIIRGIIAKIAEVHSTPSEIGENHLKTSDDFQKLPKDFRRFPKIA